MPELKVQCDCGQKYKFDVEPVNGRMPFTINCPVCGVDGTQKANALLQQMAPGPAAASPIHLLPEDPAAPIGSSAIVPPISSPATPASPPALAPLGTATTPPPAGAPKLRISGLAPASAPAGGGALPPSIAPPSTIAPPPPIGGRPLGVGGRPLVPGMAAAGQPEKKGNFWMGMVGGFSGALVGAVICFFIFKFTGIRLRFIGELGSMATGYLAGAGAAWLGKGEGSKELGGITAIFTLAAIIGAQYFTAMGWYNQEATDLNFGDTQYAQSVKEAKEAVREVPTGSDSEIRAYLIKQAVDDGDENASNSVSAADISEFRTNELVEFQGLASGKVTEQQYDQKNGIDPAAEKKAESTAQTVFKGLLFLYFLNRLNIVMLIAAVGLSYRITANA